MDFLHQQNHVHDDADIERVTTSIRDLNRAAMRLKLMISVIFFCVVVFSNYSLFAETTQPHAQTLTNNRLKDADSTLELFLPLNHGGANCLLDAQVQDIFKRVHRGENVLVQLESHSEQLTEIDFADDNSIMCFTSSKDHRVCMQPSTRCQESVFGSRHRHLEWTDEEYDLRCQAYIASLDPELWDYMQSFMPECIETCQELGCPCTCFNCHIEIIPEDFVVPDDFAVDRTSSVPVEVQPFDADVQSSSDAPSVTPSTDPTSDSKDHAKIPLRCWFRLPGKLCRK